MMTAQDQQHERLEEYEFMMGRDRGRLAAALDVLNDALAQVGSHAVFCRNAKRPNEPTLAIQSVMDQIHQGKALIQDVMQSLKTQQPEQDS